MTASVNIMVNFLDDICSRICSYLKDSKLKSFTIINAERREDAQAIIYTEYHLGIESWCIEELYCYVHKRSLSKRLERLEEIVTVACLLNPNAKTFWNIRRELVLKQRLNYHNELLLIARLLAYQPKCHEAYTYRKWLITQMLNNKVVHSLNIEHKFVKSIADVLTNNHMAWDYFRSILNIFEPRSNMVAWTMEMYQNMKKWIELHVSDTSGMSFLGYLFTRVLQHHKHLDDKFRVQILEHISDTRFKTLEGSDAIQVGLVLYELNSNQSMIKFYPNHEALWSYRQFLTYLWLKELPSRISENGMRKFDEIATSRGIQDQFRLLYHNMNELYVGEVDNNNEWYVKRFKAWWKSICDYEILV